MYSDFRRQTASMSHRQPWPSEDEPGAVRPVGMAEAASSGIRRHRLDCRGRQHDKGRPRSSFLRQKRTSAVNDDDRSLKLGASNEELVLFVIRIVCLGLLGYWSFVLISPFLTIIVWSVIITVALYPVFDWLSAKLYGHRALAAIAITVFMFFVLLGPVTWLAVSLAETVRALLARFGDGSSGSSSSCPKR